MRVTPAHRAPAAMSPRILLLETTETPIEEIATAVGFDTAVTFRHHSRQAMHTSPAAYRRTFHSRARPA